MAKRFSVPFAASGDKVSVPDVLQPSGDVSYTEGYSSDYSADQDTDPSAKDVERQKFNQILNDVTDATKELQEVAALIYLVDIDYPVGSKVTGSDDIVYIANIANGPASSVINPVGDTTGTWAVFFSGAVDTKSGRLNKLINGGFDVWRRGTSQTSSGYGSDDMWVNSNTGTTKVHQRQSFTIGQTEVPGNPRYYSQTIVTSVAGSSNSCTKGQAIEGVETYSGETVTISFYARADSVKNIAIEITQDFGAGGSATVNAIGVNKITLSTTFQRYTATVSVPSIAGKIVGGGGDDSVSINFWFDAGSDLNARTDSLGQQSGTFDIGEVQIENGAYATDFQRLSFEDVSQQCRRSYWDTGNDIYVPLINSFDTTRGITIFNPVVMRSFPTVIATSNVGTVTIVDTGNYATRILVSGVTASQTVVLTSIASDAGL